MSKRLYYKTSLKGYRNYRKNCYKTSIYIVGERPTRYDKVTRKFFYKN